MDEKKEHILVIAEKLIAEGNFEGTSVRKIAQKAGVNIAMISYYFNSKEGLLKSIVEYRTKIFYSNLRILESKKLEPWDKLNRYIDLTIDQMVDNPEYTRIVNMELTVLQRTKVIEVISRYISWNSQLFYHLLEECDLNLIGELKILPNMFFGYIAQVVTSPYFYSLTMVSDIDSDKILKHPYKEELKENIRGFIRRILEKLVN